LNKSHIFPPFLGSKNAGRIGHPSADISNFSKTLKICPILPAFFDPRNGEEI